MVHRDADSGVTLSNDTAGRTHWDQLFLPLEHPRGASTRGNAIDLALKSFDGDVWVWGGAIESERPDNHVLCRALAFGAPPNAARLHHVNGSTIARPRWMS